MTDESANKVPFEQLPKFAQLYDFTPMAEVSRAMLAGSAKIGTTMQALNLEWTRFVAVRLGEDNRLCETLLECKTLPEMQRAYAQFWEKAVAQYSEEAQRVMRITQGASEEAAHAMQEQIDKAAEPQARAA